MRRRAILLAMLLAPTALALAAVPAAAEHTATCALALGESVARGTFGKLVLENVLWPQDFFLHLSYYLTCLLYTSPSPRDRG